MYYIVYKETIFVPCKLYLKIKMLPISFQKYMKVFVEYLHCKQFTDEIVEK